MHDDTFGCLQHDLAATHHKRIWAKPCHSHIISKQYVRDISRPHSDHKRELLKELRGSGRQRPECRCPGISVVLPIFLLLESDLVGLLGPYMLLYPWPAIKLFPHLASANYARF